MTKKAFANKCMALFGGPFKLVRAYTSCNSAIHRKVLLILNHLGLIARNVLFGKRRTYEREITSPQPPVLENGGGSPERGNAREIAETQKLVAPPSLNWERPSQPGMKRHRGIIG
jgi:hypothetical protein